MKFLLQPKPWSLSHCCGQIQNRTWKLAADHLRAFFLLVAPRGNFPIRLSDPARLQVAMN